MKSTMKILAWANKLILVTATLVLFGCDPEATEQQMIQSAKTYLEQNKLREAALELRNVLQQNSNNPEARYLLGIINLDVGDTASAEKEFRRAADAGWQEALARIGQARALIYSNAFQKVIDEIDVKDTYPANTRADLYALQALAHASQGNIDQASQILNHATEIDKDTFHVLKSTIQIQLANNEIERARGSLNDALAKYNNNRELLLISAAISVNSKNFSEATETFKNIISHDPDKLVTIYGRQARLGLSRLYISNSELDSAQTTMTPLFTQNASDPETNYVGGLLAFKQGDLSLAEERLLAVLKLAPNHAPTQLLYGTVNYAQQDYEQSAYYIAKYVSAAPEDMEARKLLGRAYIKLGQNTEAQAALQPGIEDSSDAELLALISLSQLQGGDIASGIEGLEKAVKAAPESSSLRNELAKAYITAGETQSAIKELNLSLAQGGDKRRTETLLISAHLKSEQYDKAIDVALNILQDYPDDPAALSLAGNVFVLSNDRAEARKYFNKALQIRPDYAPATMLLARLEIIENQPVKAEALYKKLAEMNTADTAPLMALARLAESQNNKIQMLEWLEKARKASAGDIESRKILAEHYLRVQELDKATLLISEAVKIAPRDDTVLLLQAKLQIAEGQNNKSLATLNELVTRKPDSILARTMLAEVYLKLDQRKDARRQLDIALEKQPYYVPAMLLVTSLELRSGNATNALAFANKIQKIIPDLYLGYELAGDAEMIKKDFIAAKNSYQQAMQHKQLASLAIKISEATTRTGDFAAATEPLLAWLSDHPDDTRVLEFLGTAYQNMTQNQKAVDVYEKVLMKQPDNIVALNNLAWLYSLERNPRSLELAEKAYALNSSDAGIQDTYGWVLVQHGQTDKGRRLLEQAFKSLQDVPEVQYHYAASLLKSGEETKARKILERLLGSDVTFIGRNEAELLLK